MEIINSTPFTFSPFIGRMPFPGYSLTLIVKGTFLLRPDEEALLADEQLYPTGDEYYQDDKSQQSLFYESDFAHFKPNADLLLVGRCHAPGNAPVKACQAVFKVGNAGCRLAVFGDRYWRELIGTITDPEPFTSIALRYENSFGGPGYEKNPIGKGYGHGGKRGEKGLVPLPNIEFIDDLIDSPTSTPDPAGFGPINRIWQQRRSMLGTYGQRWLAERWPWFPADFDWAYHNAAPGYLQNSGYLAGDEGIYLENLHPEISKYRSALPGLRVRCFLTHRGSSGGGDPEFLEVGLNLDTLWIDMETERLVLVWRGITNVSSEDYEEIANCFIVSEPMNARREEAEFYNQQLNRLLLSQDEEFGEEFPEGEDGALSIDEEVKQAMEEVERAKLELQKGLESAGMDLDFDILEPSEEERELEARLVAKYGLERYLAQHEWSRQDVEEAVKTDRSLAGEDLSGLDLSGLDLQGADLTGALLTGADLKNAVLDGAMLQGADLSCTNLAGASLRNVDAQHADLTGASLARVSIDDANLTEAVMEKAVLEGASMKRVDFRGGYFSGVNMTGARFSDCLLDESDMSWAIMDGAIFEDCSLKDVSVEGTQGDGLKMIRCDLTGFRASEGCSFKGAEFRQVSAPDSVWEGAVLTGADFSMTDMEGADFSSATLSRADLSAADLKQARFVKAELISCNCQMTNLFEASFEKADLSGSDFSGSNLYGAEFIDANISSALFRGANLKMTKLVKMRWMD